MAHYGYTRQVVVFDGTSLNSSLRTSNPIWIGDASTCAASYSTTQAVASVVSIDASLSDGYQSTLTSAAAPNVDWTRYAALSGNTAAAITVGPRWLRFIRAATDSQGSVVVSYRAT